MEPEVRRSRCARGRKKGLNGRVASKIAVHGGPVIPSNCLIKDSRDVYEPLILEVACFCGKVRIVFSCHETGLVQYSEKPLTYVSEGLNDTGLDPFASGGRIIS